MVAADGVLNDAADFFGECCDLAGGEEGFEGVDFGEVFGVVVAER